MDFEWYEPMLAGVINPFIVAFAMGVGAAMWARRCVSNRALNVANVLLLTSWFINVDCVVSQGGWGATQEMLARLGCVPPLSRYVGYLAVSVFFAWGAFGWLTIIHGKEEVEKPRGWPYLKEQLAKRRVKSETPPGA